jgi:TolA-binding protein
LESYYDTKFAKDALFFKGESLYELDRKAEADEAFKELISKYPKSKHITKAKNRVKEITSELSKMRKANGVSASDKQEKKQ